MKIETRPWGRFVVLYADKDTWLKRLIIAPGQSLSLQSHQNRDEYWFVQDEGLVAHLEHPEVGVERHDLVINEVVKVPAFTKHRVTNTSDREAHLVEWAVGRPIESDIIRYEDKYGRS